MELYDFSQQGLAGFTTITDKKLLPEAIYQTNRLFMVREAAGRFDSTSVTDTFATGTWLYTDTNGYYSIKVDKDTFPTKLPRHIDIIKKYSNELGVEVTEENRLEINRTYNRGFNLWETSTETYTIYAGTFFETNMKKNVQLILDDFNVPENANLLIILNESLDKTEPANEKRET